MPNVGLALYVVDIYFDMGCVVDGCCGRVGREGVGGCDRVAVEVEAVCERRVGHG